MIRAKPSALCGSGGVAAQARTRISGRGIDYNPNALYDARANVTYNVISAGKEGVSTTIAARGEAMIGYSVQDPRKTCSIYAGVSSYMRASAGSPNNGGATSARFVAGPETGLACDVGGVLLEISPSVG